MKPNATSLVLPLLHVVVAPLAVSAPSIQPACPTGHFEGVLEFRGDSWPVRLKLTDEEDRLHAALDLPELVMADEPAAIRCDGIVIWLELPFGFGEIGLEPTSRGLLGTRPLAGDTLVLRLERGEAPPYEAHDVTFGDDVHLAGRIYVPRGAGPYPAVVLIHGSGAQGLANWSYRSWADVFARLGVAVLLYDKRGVGDSEGAFETDSAFSQLTTDARAGVRALQQHPKVDPKRVGLAGGSQAGWIAFRAAAVEPSVAFLVLWSVPAVSVAEQEIQRIRVGMLASGFDADAVAQAIAHTRLLMYHAVSGRAWDAVAESTRRAATTSWSDWVQMPDAPKDLDWWRTHATVDPGPDIAALHIPLLAVASLEDLVVPAAPNAGTLRVLLEGAEVNGTVLVLKRGDHRIELPAGPDQSGLWRFPRINPAMLDGLTSWLRLHVLRD